MRTDLSGLVLISTLISWTQFFFTKVFPRCHLFKEQLLYITREANIWIIELPLGSVDMALRQSQAKEPFLCVGQICLTLYFDTECAASI